MCTKGNFLKAKYKKKTCFSFEGISGNMLQRFYICGKKFVTFVVIRFTYMVYIYIFAFFTYVVDFYICEHIFSHM